MREKQNSCLIISDWSENMPFLLQNSFFAILVVIRQKPVQKEELVKNAIFSLLAGRHWRINVNKSLITYKKQILTDFTNLRKSCDLASARSRSVSIPSGCRGNPESNEAIARITVASSSLHIKTKMHVISRVRARCNQWQNYKKGVGRESFIFPFFKLAKRQRNSMRQIASIKFVADCFTWHYAWISRDYRRVHVYKGLC